MPIANIRKSRMTDLPRLMEIYAGARERMAASGNPHQWGDDAYPPRELIEKDIADGISRVMEDENGEIVGTFCFFTEEEPDYRVIEEGKWLNDAPYGTIHRVAGDGKTKGIVAAAAVYGCKVIPNLKIDTHRDNHVMQHALAKLGFVYCGVVKVGEQQAERLAYQLDRTENK